MLKFFKSLSPNFLVRRSSKALSCSLRAHNRSFADSAHTDLPPNKQYVIQGTENEQRVRVRRARASDVARVLRFVREHSRATWPSLLSAPLSPSSASQVALADYVSRALAQGHSMLAEQIATKRGWLTVRGLALAAAVCPWDAHLLEKWARCMRDTRSRRLFNFTAHCLRTPSLHDKYRVHNILQVTLLLAPESQNNSEIAQVLVKSIVQRGKDAGIPLLRFDVTNDTVAKVLEDLKLNKEWHLAYDVLPDTMKELGDTSKQPMSSTEERKGHFVAVYTILTSKAMEEKKGDTLDSSPAKDETMAAKDETGPAKDSNDTETTPDETSTTDSPIVNSSPTSNPKSNPTGFIPTQGTGSTSILSSFQKMPAWIQSTKPNHAMNSSPRPTTLNYDMSSYPMSTQDVNSSYPSPSEDTNSTPKPTQDLESHPTLSQYINSIRSRGKKKTSAQDTNSNPAQAQDINPNNTVRFEESSFNLTLTEDKTSDQDTKSTPKPIEDINSKSASTQDILQPTNDLKVSPWMLDETSSSTPNQDKITQNSVDNATAPCMQDKNLKSTTAQNITLTHNINAVAQDKKPSSSLTRDIIAPAEDINGSPTLTQDMKPSPAQSQKNTAPASYTNASSIKDLDHNLGSAQAHNLHTTAQEVNVNSVWNQDTNPSPVKPDSDSNTSPKALDTNPDSTQNVTIAAKDINANLISGQDEKSSLAAAPPIVDLNGNPMRAQNTTNPAPENNTNPDSTQNVPITAKDINANLISSQDVKSSSAAKDEISTPTPEKTMPHININVDSIWAQDIKLSPTLPQDFNTNPISWKKGSTLAQDITSIIDINGSPLWAQDRKSNPKSTGDVTTPISDINASETCKTNSNLSSTPTQDIINLNSALTQKTSTNPTRIFDVNSSPAPNHFFNSTSTHDTSSDETSSHCSKSDKTEPNDNKTKPTQTPIEPPIPDLATSIDRFGPYPPVKPLPPPNAPATTNLTPTSTSEHLTKQPSSKPITLNPILTSAQTTDPNMTPSIPEKPTSKPNPNVSLDPNPTPNT